MKFLLLLLILIIPQSVFAINVDDSLLGLSSTKIRVLLGEPIEKVEYKILNKHSFLYQDYILYFKDDVLTKIRPRNENIPTKKIVVKEQVEESREANSNLINEMFSSN